MLFFSLPCILWFYKLLTTSLVSLPWKTVSFELWNSKLEWKVFSKSYLEIEISIWMIMCCILTHLLLWKNKVFSVKQYHTIDILYSKLWKHFISVKLKHIVLDSFSWDDKIKTKYLLIFFFNYGVNPFLPMKYFILLNQYFVMEKMFHLNVSEQVSCCIREEM